MSTRVLVSGATGYIGGRLVPRLIAAGHAVRALARDSARLTGRFAGAEIVEGDLFDAASIRAALEGIEVAYYLVHSMANGKGDFAARDRDAAEIFSKAARDAGVRRIVYLGGLGADGQTLSRHLRSRHETGRMLRVGGVPVIEFRAAMIVGSGSASFEMLRYLTERLPVMLVPKWVKTRCQPIAVRDVLAYLEAALERPSGAGDAIVEIGGADVLTYREMMLRYAAIRGLKRTLVPVPYFSPRLSSGWIHLVTPIPSSIARPLVDGLRSDVVVRGDFAQRAFPDIAPVGYDDAVRRALDRYSTVGPETTWFDAFDVRVLPGNFTGSEQGMLIDRREQRTRARRRGSSARLLATLGGKRGWLYANSLWDLRGMTRSAGRRLRHASWPSLRRRISARRRRRSISGASKRTGSESACYDCARRCAYRAKRGCSSRRSGTNDGRDDLFAANRVLRAARDLRLPLLVFACLPFHALIFGNMAKRVVADAEAASERQAR